MTKFCVEKPSKEGWKSAPLYLNCEDVLEEALAKNNFDATRYPARVLSHGMIMILIISRILCTNIYICRQDSKPLGVTQNACAGVGCHL